MGQPDRAGCASPNGDDAVDAGMELAIVIDGVQAAADIFKTSAEAGEYFRFQIDIAKFDGAGAGSLLAQLAGKLGVSPETINAQLAERLPQVVDQMTPNGKVEETQTAA